MDHLYTEKQCFNCQGTGNARGQDCPLCGGSGVEVLPNVQSDSDKADDALVACLKRQIELQSE